MSSRAVVIHWFLSLTSCTVHRSTEKCSYFSLHRVLVSWPFAWSPRSYIRSTNSYVLLGHGRGSVALGPGRANREAFGRRQRSGQAQTQASTPRGLAADSPGTGWLSRHRHVSGEQQRSLGRSIYANGCGAFDHSLQLARALGVRLKTFRARNPCDHGHQVGSQEGGQGAIHAGCLVPDRDTTAQVAFHEPEEPFDPPKFPVKLGDLKGRWIQKVCGGAKIGTVDRKVNDPDGQMFPSQVHNPVGADVACTPFTLASSRFRDTVSEGRAGGQSTRARRAGWPHHRKQGEYPCPHRGCASRNS